MSHHYGALGRSGSRLSKVIANGISGDIAYHDLPQYPAQIIATRTLCAAAGTIKRIATRILIATFVVIFRLTTAQGSLAVQFYGGVNIYW